MRKFIFALLLLTQLTACAAFSPYRLAEPRPDYQYYGQSDTQKWAEKRMASDPEMGAKFDKYLSDDTAVIEVFDQNGIQILYGFGR